MNSILVSIGPITITWYAALIMSGMLIGLFITMKELTNNHNINKEVFYDIAFYGILFGFIGARTWYVLFSLPYYLDNPLEIIAIWKGGMAIHGGLIGGLIAIIYFTKKHKINTMMIFDAIVPSVLLGQSIGRWGNFVNQEAFGGETTETFLREVLRLPNFIVEGMNINGVYHHPTFLYELIWCSAVAIALILWGKKLAAGQVFSAYVGLYSIGRLFIEIIRIDQANTIAGLRVNVWVSAIVATLAIANYLRLGRSSAKI